MLIHGADTWLINKKEKRKLLVFENSYKKYFWLGVWQWRMEEIRNLYRDSKITVHVRTRRWGGQVTSLKENKRHLSKKSKSECQTVEITRKAKEKMVGQFKGGHQPSGSYTIEEAAGQERTTMIVGKAYSLTYLIYKLIYRIVINNSRSIIIKSLSSSTTIPLNNS